MSGQVHTAVSNPRPKTFNFIHDTLNYPGEKLKVTVVLMTLLVMTAELVQEFEAHQVN